MKHTSEIFQRLSNGKFISANSIDPASRALYNDLEENQQDYADYFSQIDFQLCAGDGYFYFARKEAKINVENKLQGLLQWIAEQISEIEGMYKVMSAFHYIENIIDCINISEEVSNEIPE